MTERYEAPTLVLLGKVEELTAHTTTGNFYDHTVMIGEPIQPDQKNSPGLGLS